MKICLTLEICCCSWCNHIYTINPNGSLTCWALLELLQHTQMHSFCNLQIELLLHNPNSLTRKPGRIERVGERPSHALATWVKSSVWKWAFTKALAWASYCSSWFWKRSFKSFIQNVPGKTCMQMTWSSSLNLWRNYNRSWSYGRPTWKERDFGSIWAKPRSWYLGQGSMCLRSLAKTSVACVSRASTQILFSVVVVPVGSTRNAVASLAVWSLMPASGVNSALDRPRPVDGRLMTRVTVGREKLEVVPSFCYLLILRWRLWTRYYHKMLCRRGQIQQAPAPPHLPLISHHLQRKSLQFVCQECHAACKRNLGPNLIRLASPAM